jgi:hypothetical protein
MIEFPFVSATGEDATRFEGPSERTFGSAPVSGGRRSTVGFLRARLRTLVLVAVVGTLLGAAVSVAYVAGQPQPCCGSQKPFVSILPVPLSRMDATLAQGDGHAFAAIAEDPLMQRPEVFRDPRDFAYREQRPVWGYLAWAGSLGRAGAVGWALLVLTALSCGLACAVTAALLMERGRSAWWAMVVPVVGFETLTELTPELLAFALLGAGLLLWRRSYRNFAVVAFAVAALTRETMLVGVAALALWELWHARGALGSRIRLVTRLAIPFAVYTAWICVVRLRLGNWPFNRSGERLGAPGTGLLDALGRAATPSTIGFWVVVAVVCTGAAVLRARGDVLTWIAVAYLGLATVLGPDVWLTIAGYQRTLVPLFLCAFVAALGGVPAERRSQALTRPSAAPASAR